MKLTGLYLLSVVVESFTRGLTSLVETQQTVAAAVGGEASFYCKLKESRDVLQVTWQKMSPHEKYRNFATKKKYVDLWVDDEFKARLEFIEAGLQSCSIVLRKVKQQDEGCYRCWFDIYHEGSVEGTTCLQVYELHEPVLHIIESNSPEDSVVSCSATGRPAPTVTLNVSQQPDLHFYNYSTVSVTNTNGTVTVTTVAVLSGYHGDATEVSCAARLLSVPEVQVFQKIRAVKQSSADGDDEPASNDNLYLIIGSSLVVVAVAAVVSIFLLLYRYKHNNRDSENMEMQQKPVEDISEFKPEIEPLRKRTPPEKNPECTTPLMKNGLRHRSSQKKTPEEKKTPKPGPATRKKLDL